MKKVVKGLLIVFVAFIGLNSVKAISDDTSIIYNKSSSGRVTISDLLLNDGRNYYFIPYTLTNSEDTSETYRAYCLDPQSDAASRYKVDHILGSSSSERTNAYDYAMLAIMKEVYSGSYTFTVRYDDDSGSGTITRTLTGNDLYAATSIAVRVIDLGIFGFGAGASSDSDRGMASAHINIAISRAARYPEYSNIIYGVTCSDEDSCRSQYASIVRSEYKYNWYRTDRNFTWSNADRENSEGYAIINASNALTVIGMRAAAEYLENGAVAGDSTVTGEIQSTVQDSRTDSVVQEYIYAQISVSDFDEDGYINNLNFACENCSSSGITYDYMEFYNASNEWERVSSSTNLLDALNANSNGLKTGNIRIRVHITKRVEGDDCNNASYRITYDYMDPSKQFVGALLTARNETDRQRMVIIDEVEGEAITGEMTGTIGCANAVCSTTLSIPICSDNEEEAISQITAPTDIKKCILDGEDDAGNTYQLSTSNGGVANSYCEVFCKEDYFDVINDGKTGGVKLNPVVKDVNCGGFFQLTAHVEGKKDCYTGGNTDDKRINKEQYLADIERIQRDFIKTLNEYNMYYAMANHPRPVPGTYPYSCGDVSSINTLTTSYDSYIQYYSPTFDDEKNGTLRGTYIEPGEDNVMFGDRYNCIPDCDESDVTVGDDEIDIDDNEPVCTYDARLIETAQTGYNRWANEVNSRLQTAIRKLNDLKTEYEQTIRNYNACTTVWTNDFPFAQKLEYYYSEYHYQDEYTPYYDLLAAAGNEELYYLEVQPGTLRQETEVEICLEGANDEYECTGASSTFSSQSVPLDSFNATGSYGDVFEDRNYIICTTDGCETQEQNISQATFVRKTVKKSQDYITPTVFYQIEANGRITVNSGYTGNALKLDALINSLPVSPSTTGGGIFSLLLEDFGEFYDTGMPGRLIDFGDATNNNSVAEALGSQGIQTFDGEYICYYESPCRPEECPNCEFVCDEDECYWTDCPTCNFECINCLFNLDELQTNFRPISPNNVNSANREFGYNWNVTTTLTELQLLKDKAETTISEIEEDNETIYDKTGDDSELDFSIRLTPDIINDLKAYNASVEDEGGYANDSLTCYAATINGQSYANIYCYSDVIDDLIEKYDDQITAPNRNNDAANRNDANANADNYWQLWSNWRESATDANGAYVVIGGPSWK